MFTSTKSEIVVLGKSAFRHVPSSDSKGITVIEREQPYNLCKLKDIVAVPQYKTTWGSKSFKDQVLDIEAWVYKRLRNAGAVLVVKLVSGSLAYDDIWFGGRTRNPWNIEEYSTGSSAGPASSTSAGLVPFAIGSETAGSMTYAAARCGVTALRPTFGIVGRTGVMSLSEILDKLGPFCRSAADCAIILDSIRGKDPVDLSSRNILFDDPFMVDITKLTVGYLDDADMEVVHVLQSKGVKVVPFELNYTVDSVQGILNYTMDVDMLAHFDEWQRAGMDDDYEAQDQWTLEIRRARVVTAVDYIQDTAGPVRDLPPSLVGDPDREHEIINLVEEYGGREIKAIVEYVKDGSTLHVYLLPDYHHVRVFVAGVKAPSIRNWIVEPLKTEAEDLGRESKHFTEIHLIGSVCYLDGQRKDLATLLVENGLARYVDCVLLPPDAKRSPLMSELGLNVPSFTLSTEFETEIFIYRDPSRLKLWHSHLQTSSISSGTV
ncbi:hypothetical protein POM88_051303 [Heracleum sosnowskyi]|uniref:TNase-like domain-containing protein n=1 Tax=Heracleum sosnowskyi TaxID=360622 RepID=A0AAD8H1M6_9APIA|nr:hypothetical protein POM88_051303 [Heracleum sosnowskyi]